MESRCLIVTIVSECSKKSAVRSRRILSAYLKQTGRRTWMGHISKEGLCDLESELKKIATRSNALLCFRHRGQKPPVVEWLVGNTNHFDADGTYCYSHFTENNQQNKILHPQLLILRDLVALSGLCHDLGKSTVGFQKKLSASVKGKKRVERDVVRHEIVSAIILQGVLNNVELLSLTNDDQLKDIFNATAQEMLNDFSEDISRLIKVSEDQGKEASLNFENFSTMTSNLLSQSVIENKILDTSLLWLVITHHKMLNANIKTTSVTTGRGRNKKSATIDYLNILIDWRYINKNYKEDVKAFLTLTNTPPWSSQKWRMRFIDCINSLRESYNKQKGAIGTISLSGHNQWVDNLLYRARPALIFADYNSSMEKEICKDQEPDLITYANTIQDGREVKWADSLVFHLTDVCNRSTNYFENQFCTDNRHYLPCIEQKDLPAGMNRDTGLDEGSPFYWQQKAAITLGDISDKKEINGFFGIILSKTGAGKTRGAPLIMSALSERIRFSVLLGRRALVTQTYKAYTSDFIGFKESEVAMLIGSRTMEYQIFTDGNITGSGQGSESDQDDFGSDAFVGEASCLEIYGKENNQYIGDVESLYEKNKETLMLKTPINVMTIDHIINSASQNKGVDTKLLYLLKNTDIILDEIDDYDAKDLISIGKLIYLSGIFGRKVIVASATTSHEILAGLMHSYFKGYFLYAEMHSIKKEVRNAFISSDSPYVMSKVSSQFEESKISLIDFVNEFNSSISVASIQHKIKFSNVGQDDKSGIDFVKVDDEIRNLHKHHHNITRDGVCVSLGFVRFNHVKSAQEYAIHLSQQSWDGTLIKVVCYHSRMMSIDRYVVESNLDEVLNRNGRDVTDHELIRNIIDEAKKNDKQNVIVVVSTTSIQETGRDHDYDWACAEPLSDKSLVQLAGRVWRHRRDKRSSQPAIYVFSNTLKGYAEQERPWGFPGIESDSMPKNSKEIMYPVATEVSSRITEGLCRIGVSVDVKSQGIDAPSVLSHHIKNEGVSAKACLEKPVSISHSYMHALESLRQHELLRLNDVDSFNSICLGSFINRNDAKMTSYHWDKSAFRKSDRENITLFQDRAVELRFSESRWVALDRRREKVNVEISHTHPEGLRLGHFLFEYDVTDEAKEYAKQYGKEKSDLFMEIQFSCAFVPPKSGITILYSKELGFYW